MSTPPLALTCEGWDAELRPASGGLISALRFDGHDVLRPMQRGSNDPRDASCFPMVPFCNRIAMARYRCDGTDYELARNSPPEPHALHGFGWQSDWSVLVHNHAEAVLQHIHYGSDGWPWPYRAQMRVRLTPAGCMIGLTLTNHADRPMPAGLGLHPYFVRSAESLIRFDAGDMIELGSDSLPTGAISPNGHFADMRAGAPFPAQMVDHCFTNWKGEVRIATPHSNFLLDANGAPNLHVFSPADSDFFCLEPVSHTPDALNRSPDQITRLAPGNSAFLSMRILKA